MTITVVSEDRFLMYRHLRTLVKLGETLEDALYQLAEGKQVLLDNLEGYSNQEVVEALDNATALMVFIETQMAANDKRIRFIQESLGRQDEHHDQA